MIFWQKLKKGYKIIEGVTSKQPYFNQLTLTWSCWRRDAMRVKVWSEKNKAMWLKTIATSPLSGIALLVLFLSLLLRFPIKFDTTQVTLSNPTFFVFFFINGKFYHGFGDFYCAASIGWLKDPFFSCFINN